MRKEASTFGYNDYELLYMISEGSSEAMDILINKYKPLVYSRIKKFRIIPSQIDDFYQESLILIYKAVKIYDDGSKMTFTNFYDLLIQRRFIDLLRQNKKYYENNILSENVDIVVAYKPKEEESNDFRYTGVLSDRELQIYTLKYIQHLSVKEIATKLNVSINQVYSATDRIKLKYKYLNERK